MLFSWLVIVFDIVWTLSNCQQHITTHLHFVNKKKESQSANGKGKYSVLMELRVRNSHTSTDECASVYWRDGEFI